MNLDIAPTMLDAAGVPIPKDMQGKSILPVLTDNDAKGRKAMYYHYYENGEHAVSPHFGIRTERYKLIRFYKRVECWELYDLKKDPAEMKNVFGNRRYKKLRDKLRKELDVLIQQYEDKDATTILMNEKNERNIKKGF